MRDGIPIDDGDGVRRQVSLPRRDGQGPRRRITILLLVGASLISACGGIAREPMDHADVAPPTRGTVPSPSESSRRRADPEPLIAGTFDATVVGEASGVAASVRNPGWVYVLDDGPGARGVIAVDTSGGRHVEVRVEGLHGRDTEGLAVARCATGSPADTCLYIGDIGNNEDLWTSVDVWRVPEPVLRPRPRVLNVRGARRTYAYEGAPVNAEALLVSAGRPFVVSKERRDPETGTTPRPRLMAAERWDADTLRDLGRIPLPGPRVGLAAAVVGNVVTGGDVARDLVVLRTYDHVVAYTPPEPGMPLDTLAGWEPREVTGLPALPQPEGVAIDRCGLWLVSERVDSLWLVPWPAEDIRAGAEGTEEQRCPSGDGGS